MLSPRAYMCTVLTEYGILDTKRKKPHFSARATMGHVVLTAPPKTGKTTACRRFIEEHRNDSGVCMGGFLRIDQDLVDVSTDAHFPFLCRRDAMDPSADPNEYVPVGSNKCLRRAVFDRANAIYDAFVGREMGRNSVFFLDEFGLLERERGGHYELARKCVTSPFRTVFVVRDHCLPTFLADFGGLGRRFVVLSVTVENRDSIPSQMAALLEKR